MKDMIARILIRESHLLVSSTCLNLKLIPLGQGDSNAACEHKSGMCGWVGPDAEVCTSEVTASDFSSETWGRDMALRASWVWAVVDAHSSCSL